MCINMFFVFLSALLVDANSKPFSVTPPTMANIIKNLFSLKPGKNEYF